MKYYCDVICGILLSFCVLLVILPITLCIYKKTLYKRQITRDLIEDRKKLHHDVCLARKLNPEKETYHYPDIIPPWYEERLHIF